MNVNHLSLANVPYRLKAPKKTGFQKHCRINYFSFEICFYFMFNVPKLKDKYHKHKRFFKLNSV